MHVGIVKFLDRTVGTVLCLFFGLFVRKRHVVGAQKKVLFIQLWSIGETILTLPAIKSLKSQWEEASVTVLCTKRNVEVFAAAGLNVQLVHFGLIFRQFRKYDLVIDLEEYLNVSSLLGFFLGKLRVGFSRGVRSKLYHTSLAYNDQQHVTKTFLDLVRVVEKDAPDREIPRLKCSDAALDKVAHLLKEKNQVIGIAVGAGESAHSRIWPRFKELTNVLSDHHSLVFFGSKQEHRSIQEIIGETKGDILNAAGLLSLEEMFCMMGEIDLLITNDTGPLHVASAQGTKTVALFGPNTPVRFGPLTKESAQIYKKETCKFSPCINVHKGEVPDCLYAKNSKDYQKCMKAITVEDVLKTVERVLG